MRSAVKTGHRVRALGAGVLLALSAVLATGCSNEDIAETVKEAVQTPQQELLEATATSSTDPYSYTLVQKGDPADAVELNGSVNPAGKAYELSTVSNDAEAGVKLTLVYRVVDQKLWMKAKFEGKNADQYYDFPDKWMAVDAAQLKSKDIPTKFEEKDADPAQLNALMTTTADVTEGAGGKFSGKFDLTEQPEVDIVSTETRSALGAKAKSLPFTATVTGGHVTEFVLTVPATSVSKAQTYTVNYTGFGSVAPVVAPAAAETVKAPDKLYEMLAD